MEITLTTHGKVVQLELPDGDHISNVIQKNKDWYEKAMLEDIQARNLTGEAIDVGACFGTHSLYFAAICGLSVLAIEPRSDNFEVLLKNIELNRPVNIRVLNAAVGSHTGFVTLAQELAGNRGSTVATVAPIGIPLLTIDSLSTSAVALLKIDVEGMELDVLHGAEATIKHNRPMIYVEAPHTHESVSKFLRGLNYREVGKWNATPTYGFAPR